MLFRSNRENQPIAQVRQTGRSGLTATGQLLESADQRSVQLVPGQIIQEQVRGIPVDLTLAIGVQTSQNDSTIERIKSEFVNYPRFKFVPLNSGVNVAVDAVLQSKDALIWQLKTGADRLLKEGDLATLRPSLQSLLAAKVLRSLANGESARLDVTTEIRHADRKTLITTTQSRSDATRSATSRSAARAQSQIPSDRKSVV